MGGIIFFPCPDQWGTLDLSVLSNKLMISVQQYTSTYEKPNLKPEGPIKKTDKFQK